MRLALDGHLPLVVEVPVSTQVLEPPNKDGLRPTIEGLWDLVMEGEQGIYARQEVESLYRRHSDLPPVPQQPHHPNLPAGAWVERDGDRHQLDPYSHLPELVYNFMALDAYKKTNPALPHGCIIGVREEALEALLVKEVSSKPIEVKWKDATITFTSEFQVQILVNDKSHVHTYEELGCEDQKSKTPTLAWETLRELAKAEPHRIPVSPKKSYARDERADKPPSYVKASGDKERVRIQNRVNEINKTLRNALNRLGYMIPVEPAPIVFDKKSNCYEPTPGFRIMVSSSYARDESDTSLM